MKDMPVIIRHFRGDKKCVIVLFPSVRGDHPWTCYSLTPESSGSVHYTKTIQMTQPVDQAGIDKILNQLDRAGYRYLKSYRRIQRWMILEREGNHDN